MTPHLVVLIPIVLAMVIYMISVKNGTQVCDRYILVTYLYALMYLFLLGYFILLLLPYEKQLRRFDLSYFIGLIVLYLAIYFTMVYIPKDQRIVKHLISLIYIAITSVMLTIIFMMFVPNALLISILMTLMLFILLSLLAWKFQEKLASKIPLALLLVFLGLVIAEFILSIFMPNSLITQGVILLVLMVLCYFLLVKTKRMIENAKSCEKEGGPDYVNESTSLLLTFQNLLLRILELFGKRKRRYRF